MAKKGSRSKSAARKTRRTKPARKAQAKRVKGSAASPAKRKSRSPKKARSGASPANVVVTVRDSHLPHMKDLAAKLEARGMKVDSVLEGTGQITGSFAKSPSALKEIEGVAGSENIPQFQLPPPDSEVQ
jgi:hypothetical protein